MKTSNELFTQYENMVYKYVHNVAVKYGVSFDDLIGDAFERFCLAANTFDSSKGAFSTHLYTYLQRLEGNAHNIKLKRALTTDIDGEIFNEALISIDFYTEKCELTDAISRELSTSSQTYLKDLFSGTFQKDPNSKGGRPEKFPIKKIQDHYGWTLSQTRAVKEEITAWWCNY